MEQRVNPPSSVVTRTLVCVDAYSNNDISGSFYNPYMETSVDFTSFLDFASKMEAFFDGIGFPQAFNQKRSFRREGRGAGYSAPKGVVTYHADDILEQHSGLLATYLIQVQLRRNTTWQGIITWKEEDRTVHFDSMLELANLITDSLSRGACADRQ